MRAVSITIIAAVLISACGLAAGCYNFRPLHPAEAETISVSIFKNRTFWREIEFKLANILGKKFAARGNYRIVSSGEPSLAVSGVILDYNQPVVTEGAVGIVKEGSVAITVSVTIVDRAAGAPIVKDRRLTESATYVVSRGETSETAQIEAFELLSENIINLLIEDW